MHLGARARLGAPGLVRLLWLIGPDWGVRGPDASGSRVTVTFTPVAARAPASTLVHDQLDAHGPGWEGVRDGVGSDGGWPAGLRKFAAAL